MSLVSLKEKLWQGEHPDAHCISILLTAKDFETSWRDLSNGLTCSTRRI
jgi:hypothetical protein